MEKKEPFVEKRSLVQTLIESKNKFELPEGRV